MKKFMAMFALFFMCAIAQATELVIPIHVKIHGEYTVKVIHADKSEDKYNFHNVITNLMLDTMGTSTNSSGFALALALSSSNTTPSATDTTLPNPLGLTRSRALTRTVTNTAGPYVYVENYTFTFNQGDIVGNVCKIGIINAASGTVYTPLMSNALVLVAGSPACISVLSTDQVIATYTVTTTIPTSASVNFDVTTDGVVTTNTIEIKPYNLGFTTSTAQQTPYAPVIFSTASTIPSCASFSAATFNAVNSNLRSPSNCTGLDGALGGHINGTYTSGNYYRDESSFVTAGTARTIYGGGFSMFGPASWQFIFGTPISITADQKYTITLRIYWNQ